LKTDNIEEITKLFYNYRIQNMMIDLYSYQNIILFLARIVLGITFIKHGWPKVKKPFGMKDKFAELKFPVPALFSAAVALIEFFGGIFIIIGFYTQLACLLIVIDSAFVALLKRFKTKEKWLDGYELELTLLFLALLLAMFGAGDWVITY
jgi:putative oxidoreductase